MPDQEQTSFELSPRWRLGVLISVLIGLAILSWIAVRAYREAPPIPDQVVNAAGETIFTGADILAGQQVFLKYGLMENGTIWGHGAYLGPDFSAAYLHALALEAAETGVPQALRPIPWRPSTNLQRDAVEGCGAASAAGEPLRLPAPQTLAFSEPETASYRQQIGEWADYFAHPEKNGGLKTKYIDQPPRTAGTDGLFCLDRLGLGGPSPGPRLFLHQQFPLSIPWREHARRPRPTCGAP